ncbi:MAG: PhoD-like phosphatase N-terminal domain-containing protein [Rhodopila sp.]
MFNGVAAGDTTTSDAVLWTRADNGGSTTALTAQVSTDSSFSSGLAYSGSTSATADYTAKLDATGLQANTKYYYRFVAGDGTVSQVGSFSTAALASQAVEVKFGFSGDADGRFRPYTLMNGFGTGSQLQSQNLKFFTFLGDTMYETASGTPTSSPPSPAVPALNSTSSSGTQAQALAAYYTSGL